MSTVESARKRLESQRGEWPRLCREAGLTYWWVTKFAQQRIAEPGHTKFIKLLAWLDKAEADQPAAATAGMPVTSCAGETLKEA